MSALPAVLQVEDLGDGRWTAPHPADDPEGRDVVFSGQILAQMIMASDAASSLAGTLGGSPVNALADPDRTVDQLAKRLLVHIVKAAEVQAALSGLVRA